MSEERKAGQLILSQLGMFNEARILFENTVEPAVLSGIDSCIESFAEENDWDGVYKLASKDDCRFAPKRWISNPGERRLIFTAKFQIECLEDNDDYWTAVFCGKASQGGQAGFMFSLDPSFLSEKIDWNIFTQKIPQELIFQLTTSLGFQNTTNGKFFLPVLLNNEQLAKSWLNVGEEFSADDKSLIPLREALEKLKQAVPIFDQIMQNCSQTTASK